MRVRLPIGQVVQRRDQAGLVEYTVGFHQLDRQDVRLRAGLPDQPGDERTVAEEVVDHALEGIHDVGVGLLALLGRVRFPDLARIGIEDESMHAFGKPRMISHAGVQDRDDRTPPSELARRRVT